MRIKQIELNGFKSFMDRTVLELPRGVTAIVGPNGCGKSNIVDALRWVIGEQSPKHLRGDVMEDVICNGNAETGPLGMAEVSLVLERDEADLLAAAEATGEDGADALPRELARASEVLITRRYFRSGEAEYFINRVPCRLKDITELFLGTGVGTRAYAIIEQGQIERIVNAKPEELRLFIEEAAGITRFRHRKVAAERKMERTRENLVRVHDVLRELERQRASLERQARRAEQHHRLKEELRTLDLQVLAARERAWSAELASLHDRLAAVQREEAVRQEELHRLETQSGAARAQRLAVEERMRAIEAEVTEARLAAGEAQVRVAALEARSAELRVRGAQARSEVEALAVRQAALAAELARLSADLDGLTAAQAEAEAARAQAEARLAELGTAGAALESAAEAAKDALVDAVAEAARARNLGEALRQRREELAGRKRRLDEERRRLGERLHDSERAAEAARAEAARLEAERAEATRHRAALEGEHATLEREAAAAAAALEGKRAACTQLRSRAESLRELKERHEGCTRGVASLLGRREPGVVLLAGVLRVPAALERAAAAALGARLRQVVVPDVPAAVAAVRWLREAGAGSATVLPREAARRAPTIVPSGRRLLDQIEVDTDHWALAEAVLGQVLLADDLDEALRLWREASYGVTVVTLTGEALDPLGAVSGGSEPPLEELLLARARELRELDAALAAGERELALASAAVDDLRQRATVAATALAACEERLRALQLAAVAAEKDRERLEQERARVTAELEAWALEAGGVAGAEGQAAEELAAVEQRLAQAEAAVAQRRAALAARQEALASWREAHAEAERERTAAAVAAAAAWERRRAAEGAVERCRAELRETEERQRAAAAAMEEAAAGAEMAAAELAETLALRAAAEERAARLGAERERLRASVTEADAVLSSDDQAAREARAQLAALRDERGALEVAAAERRVALDHLATELKERYGLDPHALAAVAVEEGDAAARAARVEELRRRLAELGDVNPAAMQELAEVEARHGFLTAQRDDLERSLDDLRRTIAKLTRASRTRFDETFAAVNKKLGEVFPKLFPGGTTRLELTDAEEGGEPGVEIVVQPAGKQLRRLSLLSGGEKALSATALVLSLFLTRPTPFCVLDEVDAPLDEANIGRFNQLVREMAEHTQFVIITHNRRTMEVADTLYGITMERPGISKVVAVRLREAA
jgi:chromosome segregation protein